MNINNTNYFDIIDYPDNIIEGIFEKMFDQLTSNSKQILIIPIKTIYSETFGNNVVHQKIHKLSNRTMDQIYNYVTNRKFIQKFLFLKLKSKINVTILCSKLFDENSEQEIINLYSDGYRPDTYTNQILVINDELEIFKLIRSKSNVKIGVELLMYAAQYGYENFYFYLRTNCNIKPNISVFGAAVSYPLLSIVRDINSRIGLSSDVLELAFKFNHTPIIDYLLTEAIKNKIKINPEFVSYPIMNNNQIILEKMEQLNLIEWKEQLYYSAVLSGSLSMIKYLELKLPNIHVGNKMDTSKIKKGRQTLLSRDMTYISGGKYYFSHVVEYAVQSKSCDVLKYVIELGYGITLSNILTAIRQSTPDILRILCQNYRGTTKYYLAHYVGLESYISDKFEKTKILVENGLINFDLTLKRSQDDYRTENIHLDILRNNSEIIVDNALDLDYLMLYHKHFNRNGSEHPQYKINWLVLNTIRIAIEFAPDHLENIIKVVTNNMIQYVNDIIYLFANSAIIDKYLTLLPDKSILMEIICYGNVTKLQILKDKNLFDLISTNLLIPLMAMLADNNILKIIDKLFDLKFLPAKFIFMSKNVKLIKQWFHENPDKKIPVSDAKYLINTNNLQLIRQFLNRIEHPDHLIEYANSLDMLDIAKYIQTSL